MNIWTHLAGFLVFGYHLFEVLAYRSATHDASRVAPIVLQLVSYMFCMLASSLFHTFACHSEGAYDAWLQGDHFGVVFALFGTYVSFIGEAFECHPVLVLWLMTLLKAKP